VAGTHSRRKLKAPIVVVGISLLTFILALAILYALGSRSRRGRQAETTQPGSKGGSLDATKTRHTFQLMVDGGLQTVTVTDALDEAQIGLVQKYLQEEAARFQKGDFSDAMGIHDDGVPGLSELRAGARQITIRYNALSNGGQIRYITSNPELVKATHRWLMAQLSAQGKLSPSR
jgi:hypothetical protein